MKKINSFFEAIVIITIICIALNVTNVLNDFPYKTCISILLLFIAYILKEILFYIRKN